MLRLAFDFIIAWREIRARPNAYLESVAFLGHTFVGSTAHECKLYSPHRWAVRHTYAG